MSGDFMWYRAHWILTVAPLQAAVNMILTETTTSSLMTRMENYNLWVEEHHFAVIQIWIGSTADTGLVVSFDVTSLARVEY